MPQVPDPVAVRRAVQDRPGGKRPGIEAVPDEGGRGGYPPCVGVE
ncbi:hypothetical protein [Streptosporangium lutulentum]|uniref:Uncharacterized protein n=1 Tax=Streptosporangium lutulentum TaxID=1461250 RepID=A0ABT9QS05_9ACTN|nr:hypothetical protein [Streptosporangium lutulentum]MDP9849493.1 hypothetical protein [Streptosporangium lutulentum]